MPPYNQVLGGKLVSMLLLCHRIRHDFRKKYKDKKTVLRRRYLPPRLLFFTTTGAFGKSSIYNRLKFNDESLTEFIGFTKGCGGFHIPNSLFEEIVEFLEMKGVPTNRGFGTGPSRKMRLIDVGMRNLGYKKGNAHQIYRAIYLFPTVSNVREMVQGKHTQPRWKTQNTRDITEFWKHRWGLKRAANKTEYREFDRARFVSCELEKLNSEILARRE